ncbi:MAG: polysaccharide export outer membrane protein [Bacteroidetes bacterium]|nr:MAG: polysaccharide export outer membrane protein [Bacteroidota bacterium]
MLQTKKDYKFDTMKMDSTAYSAQEYRIAPNDIIEFRLFANDGFSIINLTTLNSRDNTFINTLSFQYQIDNRGVVKLPVIGEISLVGYTVRQAEDTLQKIFSKYYIDPFAMVEVVNKRVIVFPGNDGQARVVLLTNSNTTLLEAITVTGGIPQSGKAYDIKLIRSSGNPAKPNIYHFDLSRIEGIAEANLIVQANDIIYIEPRKYIARETLREITPIVSLFTTALAIYAIFSR